MPGDALYVMLCTIRCPAGALNVEEHGLSCSRETRGLSRVGIGAVVLIRKTRYVHVK